jgi:hypothetical protein
MTTAVASTLSSLATDALNAFLNWSVLAAVMVTPVSFWTARTVTGGRVGAAVGAAVVGVAVGVAVVGVAVGAGVGATVGALLPSELPVVVAREIP